MGACLSCLGALQNHLRSSSSSEAERQRLLYDDSYPNGHGNHAGPNGNTHNYGSWNNQPSSIPPQNLMSPEEVRREQQALNNITRWASDQIVEIFPHRTTLANMGMTNQLHSNGNNSITHNHNHGHQGGGYMTSITATNGHGNGNDQANLQMSTNANPVSPHQDILLSMIPGDKNKRSIRIYPASRPGSSLSTHNVNTQSNAENPSSKGLSGMRSSDSISRTKAKATANGVFVKLNVELP